MNEEGYPGYRNPDNFIVVSDPYPTVTALAADLILPTAMWMEKEGAYGNAERRSQFWRQQVKPPGEARSDLWQVVEFSKYFKIEEVWPEELIAKKPEVRGKTLYDVLYANGVVNKFPLADLQKGFDNDESHALRLLSAEGPVRGIRRLRSRPRPRSRAVRPLSQGARPALAGGRRQGDAVALPRGLRPVRQGRRGREVLRQAGRQGAHHLLPLRAGGRDARQGLRPVAVHRPRARALALRLDDAARARAAPLVPDRAAVHAPGRRHRRASCGAARRSSSRPAAARSSPGSRPAAATRCRRAWSSSRSSTKAQLVNKLTLDATCPISKETDFKKCACKVETA